ADLVPYRRLIASGLQSVMLAHVSYPAMDETPASFSRWWIERVLRGELGFRGVAVTDDLSMVGASVIGPVPRRVERALEAGCDLVLLCNAPQDVPPVLDALAGYTSPVSQLRLTRLHGRGGCDWRELKAAREYKRACAALEPLCKRPDLELKG